MVSISEGVGAERKLSIRRHKARALSFDVTKLRRHQNVACERGQVDRRVASHDEQVGTVPALRIEFRPHAQRSRCAASSNDLEEGKVYGCRIASDVTDVTDQPVSPARDSTATNAGLTKKSAAQ